MNPISEHELNLSSQLYALIGDVYFEMSELPNDRTISRWTRGEVRSAIIRCKDAFIRAQHCAIRLSRLGNIDERSIAWIEELLDYADPCQSKLEYVEETLLQLAHNDGTLYRACFADEFGSFAEID